jgi:predicted RNA binding protein YcfA (HicA-like mRNA interferase family)
MLMPKPQQYRDVVKFLRSQGWVLLRPGKGSHQIWVSHDRKQKISIPAHSQVRAGIIKQIIDLFDDVPNGWR